LGHERTLVQFWKVLALISRPGVNVLVLVLIPSAKVLVLMSRPGVKVLVLVPIPVPRSWSWFRVLGNKTSYQSSSKMSITR